MKKCLLLFALGLLSVCHASATVTFSLNVYRQVRPAYDGSYGETWFLAFPSLHDTSPPLSHHRVESPTGITSANFGTNTGAGAFAFTDADSFFNQLTNGNWKLWLNKGTPQEILYTFTLASSSLHSNALGSVAISAPANGGINVASNTPYTWSGPAGWDQVNVEATDYYGDVLDPADTNWPSGPILDPGTNQFRVGYQLDVTGDATISTPTNDTAGSLSNWAVGAVTLRSEAYAKFIVEGLTPSVLAAALDAPGMIWETEGDADWFAQGTVTHDGVDAAQSGPIGDDAYTLLRTVVYGTNQISFWWKADTDHEGSQDYVEFTDNGNFVADNSGQVDWAQLTYALTDNEAHVLEWTYYKDSDGTAGLDAVFVDQVSLSSVTPPLPEGQPVTFSLTVIRDQKHAFDGFAANQVWFFAFPSLSAPTNPISYHRVESPSNEFFGPLCSASFGPTNNTAGTSLLLSFDELADRLTNGVWKLWLNKETPHEELYEFTLAAPGFASNNFSVVTITAPADGSTGGPTNPVYQWSGPSGWEDLFARAFNLAANTNYAFAVLAPTATSWPAGPVVVPGTNAFDVRYQKSAGTDFVVSAPFQLWSNDGVTYESGAASGFVTGGAAPPSPVQLLNPQRNGGNFQFQFQSQAGRTNLVQSRTNLALGTWQDRTNIVGDGALKTVLLPIGSNPAEFFRVATQ